MVILIKALQVILSLSLLIFLHELGHFMWAKLFGIRVEKFYLFFDAGGKSIAKWKWGETEFGIGWLPFGGYCKIAGMVDESMDTKHLSEAPKEWEFRSHPAWQRLLVMAGGVLNNFIFAILSYTMILAIWGQSYIDNSTSEIYVNDTAYEMGFRTGDRILKLDDYVPENFAMLQADLARREVSTATVLRGTDTVELYIDRAMISEVLNSQLMFDLAVPFVIDSVMATGPNAGTSLKRGDRLVSINGEKVEFLQDSRPVLEGLKDSEVTLGVLRGEDTLTMKAQVDSSGRFETACNPFYRGIQVSRQFHRHRRSLPVHLGLVSVSEHNGTSLHNARRHEPDSNTGTRRRTYPVCSLRNDKQTQAKRQIPYDSTDDRHASAVRTDVFSLGQRHRAPVQIILTTQPTVLI